MFLDKNRNDALEFVGSYVQNIVGLLLKENV